MSETNPRQSLDFGYNRFADLYYYLLAHVPLDNAADVYDPEFTAEIILLPAAFLSVFQNRSRELSR